MDTSPTERAIEVLGGVVSAADVLSVKYQVVQHWVRNRVPAEYCPLIERETRARGTAILCEELRPDIQWGVVRHSVKA